MTAQTRVFKPRPPSRFPGGAAAKASSTEVFRRLGLVKDRAELVKQIHRSETLIAGMAIGMAAEGLRPVAEIQFMGFIYPALDQLLNHATRLRNRTPSRSRCRRAARPCNADGC